MPTRSSKRTKMLKTPDLGAQLMKLPTFQNPPLDVLGNSRMRTKPNAKMEAESDASSSSSEPVKVNTRTKLLQRRSRDRLRKYLDEMCNSVSQGLTLLEKKAIGDRAAKYYNQEFVNLQKFAACKRMSMGPAHLDRVLNSYFNHLFLQGFPGHRGDKIMAAVMHRHPEFGRQGSLKLPHAWRSLKGWRRLAPGASRLAYPLAVWAAICCEMRRKDQLQMALFTMIGLSSYSRPGELLRCRVCDLVRPSPTITEHWALLLNPEEKPERSKVGEFDDSVLLDSHYLKPWAAPLMRQLTNRHKEQPLWSFDYGHYSQVFQQITESMNLDMTPYQMRHSGPSIDRSRNVRSLVEVQKRGRWKSHKSVARYEKSARLAANFQALPSRLQHHCLAAERQLEAVMLGMVQPPRPPLLPRA